MPEQAANKTASQSVRLRFDLYERDKVLISSGKEGETEADMLAMTRFLRQEMARSTCYRMNLAVGHAMSSYKGKNFKYFVNTGAGCNRHGYPSRSRVDLRSRCVTESYSFRTSATAFTKSSSRSAVANPRSCCPTACSIAGVTMLVYNDPDPVFTEIPERELVACGYRHIVRCVSLYSTFHPGDRKLCLQMYARRPPGGVLGSSRRRPGRRRPPHAKLIHGCTTCSRTRP
jgi:hypothetical protein